MPPPTPPTISFTVSLEPCLALKREEWLGARGAVTGLDPLWSVASRHRPLWGEELFALQRVVMGVTGIVRVLVTSWLGW